MTTTSRRRVLRPTRATPDEVTRQRSLQKKRARFQQEHQILARWMSRLRRAFHAVEKQQVKIARLEREISRLEAR